MPVRFRLRAPFAQYIPQAEFFLKMIIYDLACDNNHHFEGWFASIVDFEKQQQSAMITCPVCGSMHTKKLPTAAHIKNETSLQPETSAAETNNRNNPAYIAKLIEQAINDTVDVGNAFADEARKIHYQEVEARNIRGTASLDDARGLAEEGINIFPIIKKLPDKLH